MSDSSAKESVANKTKERYLTSVGGNTQVGFKKRMAERDGFSTFLISAAVAGISIGGTWVLANINAARADAREIAVLATKVDALTESVRSLNDGLSTVLVLSIRVGNVEKVVDKQQEALEALRSSRVPKGTQDIER